MATGNWRINKAKPALFGLGMEFALKPRKTSIGFEARYHTILFQDRFEQEYLESGLEDTTGPMYSFITSLIFFF